MVLSRTPKMCNFIDWKDMKLVYRRYASLYFVVGVDQGDNELVTMEIIHQFVEGLDKYFGNVCELDLIFNFHKAYYILDELVLGGELQEPSKKVVISIVESQDNQVEREKMGLTQHGEGQGGGARHNPRIARGEGGAMNILSMRSVRRCSRKDSTWNFSHYIVHCKSKYNGLIHRYIVAL